MKRDFKSVLTALLLCAAAAAGAQETAPADTLSMEKIVQNLPEVMVKGSRPVAKAERGKLSYDMPLLLEKLPADNAYEALTHIPGVSDADGSVKFSGNQVTLIINGQATTLTQDQLTARLKAMPAAQLAKAEVMLAAPARYHVRGMAINIVTKDYAGTNQLSGQIEGDWKQNKYGVGIGEGFLSLQRGKFGMDAQYEYSNGSNYQEATRTANHPLNGTCVAYRDDTWQKATGVNHDYRLGFNYAFAANHRLDIAYTGRLKNGTADNTTTGTSVSTMHYSTHEYLHNVDVNYSLPFGLRLNGSFTYYSTPQEQALDGTMTTGSDGTETQRNLTLSSGQTVRKWMFTADQSHTLGHGWELSYGAKAQFTSNNNHQTTLDSDGNALPDATSSMDINERICNVYAGFSKQINKDLSLEASLEAEQYHSPVWDKWRLYPSLNALWNINENNLLNLSFSSSSEFPSYWSVMSSVFYSSTYTEIWGNPDLKPYSNYYVSLMWQLKQRYTLTAYANLNPDYFIQMPYQPTDRMAVIMKETNFDYDRNFGLQATAMYQVGKWLNGNVTAVGLYKHEKSTRFFDLPFDRKKVSAILSAVATAKLLRTQDLKLTLNPFCQTAAIQGVYDIKPLFRMNATLRWDSKDSQWGLRINAENIFNKGVDTRSVQGNQDFGMYLSNSWRTFTFTAIYKFGGFKQKRVKAVDTSRMGH